MTLINGMNIFIKPFIKANKNMVPDLQKIEDLKVYLGIYEENDL